MRINEVQQEPNFGYFHFSFVMNGKRFNYSLWGNNYQRAFNWAIGLAQIELKRES